MERIKFFDATLRDGSHALGHQYSIENITKYCKVIDRVGFDGIFVGHGNGLGASSVQVGMSKLTDYEMLTNAKKNLKWSKLGVYMIPGFGTIQDDLYPAIELGVTLFKIGCQCTEADTTKQHIEYLARNKKQVYGVLMMYHMTSLSNLVEEARKIQSYGAEGVIIMDSAGASTPEMVKKTVSQLKSSLNIEVGFHAHNNLGLAVGNSYIAIQEGATIIDGTIRGFGAGAGNCPLEVLIALLKKEGYNLGDIDFYAALDASDKVVKKFPNCNFGIDDISIVSGMAGVFSGFKKQVMQIAKDFQVDPRDIMIELGIRKAMAGQEDMIIDVADELKKKKIENQTFSF